ncbi:MAG TPA: YetF domain-containing protein [Candidatus Kapabacteria bacterium]|jgi:uncharacterized membrane protein YcaP (DUF421 family)|nr:YetF domain-containing protein [Candidatus Kapabacteria bacterium]
MLEFNPSSLVEIVLRSSVVYLFILLGFRLAGKRHVSQLSLIDFALILLVSNAVQNAMVGTDTTLVGGIVASGTLILLNVILTKAVFGRQGFAKLVSGEPRLLIRNGNYVMSNLAHESIRPEELEEQIREHGFSDISEVRTAILEMDGSISILPYMKDQHVEHHLPFVRHRHRTRRGLQP